MPTTYTRADAGTMQMLEQAVNSWHLQLKQHKVSINHRVAAHQINDAMDAVANESAA